MKSSQPGISMISTKSVVLTARLQAMILLYK